MRENEVVQCSWLEDLQHSIEEPSESQGERKEEVQKDSQEQGTVVRGQ